MTQGPRIRPLSRFVRSDQGAVAPMIGLMLLVLIGCVGIAIDTGRGVLVRARLVDALDAAGLAVGARLSTSDYTADARRFVEANFKAGYSGATVTEVVATPNAAKSVIALSATAEMPTAFMRLFGQDLVTVRATSEVTRAATGLELVLALDNTGSMAGSIGALRKSAKDLLAIVYGGREEADDLFVGLVPFSQAVNIGTSRSNWMNPDSSKPFFWNGCVEARAVTKDQRSRNLDTTDHPPVLSDKSTLFTYYQSWSGCPVAVLPMTKKKTTVEQAIDKMSAVGLTHVNLGAVWGWRMLSPKWQGFWGGDMARAGLPLNYNTPRMSKAMVLMTDGDNTIRDDTYTAYGELNQKRLGTKDREKAESNLDARLTTVCEDAKTAGVIIYSVVFNVEPGSNIEKLMQGCASQIDFSFAASNEAALNKAFKTIGDSLSNLRVSK